MNPYVSNVKFTHTYNNKKYNTNIIVGTHTKYVIVTIVDSFLQNIKQNILSEHMHHSIMQCLRTYFSLLCNFKLRKSKDLVFASNIGGIKFEFEFHCHKSTIANTVSNLIDFKVSY